MKTIWLSGLFLLFSFSTNAAEREYRCTDKIISTGDAGSVLAMKCGEPDWKESHTEEILDTDEKGNKHKTIIAVEEWTYNLGPDRLQRIFKLRDGKVVEIRSSGYGFAKDERIPSECGGRVISTGDSAAEVAAKCGEPAWKDRHDEIIRERVDENTVRKVVVTVEDWTYNFGPNRLLRIFTMRNGRVTAVRTGDYGD